MLGTLLAIVIAAMAIYLGGGREIDKWGIHFPTPHPSLFEGEDFRK